jgi:hypothetical protein
MVQLLTVDGDCISRCEMFDEADLDAALARFDALSRPTSRLENAASRANARFWMHFAARDWTAMAGLLADDVYLDDRRPMVGSGVRHGRDAQIQDVQAIAAFGVEGTTEVIAVRGERLVLDRIRFHDAEHPSGGVVVEVLNVLEIDVGGRMIATVAFDPDDIAAAFEELDARYLAGEASAYAHTWSRAVWPRTSVARWRTRRTPASG